jgi:hypothetical protein
VVTRTSSSSKNQFSERTSSVQILPDDKLLIRGTLTDEVQHLGNAFSQMLVEGLDQPPSGGNLTDFMRGLVNGFHQSFEEAMEVLFQILIQRDTSLNQTPTADEEITSLRVGFGSCLGLVKAWGTTLADLEDGKALIVNGGSPNESKMFNQFLQRAFQTTAHARLCVTSHGCVGIVPDRTDVGDLVAVFHGSATQFVLRDVGQEERKENDEVASYRFVGSGYLLPLTEGKTLSDEPEKDQNIRLI